MEIDIIERERERGRGLSFSLKGLLFNSVRSQISTAFEGKGWMRGGIQDFHVKGKEDL